jgi:shikimate kinase
MRPFAVEGVSVLPRPIPALARPNRKHRPTPARRNAHPSAIILVGFMGAGKTSVGRALAGKLGWTFEDLDDRVERREHRTVPEIFCDGGESAFRHAERAALRELVRELRGQPERIVALGGGAFVQKQNADLIAAAGLLTIFLDATSDELWRRCCETQQAADRPLLGNLESFRDLYDTRRAYYLKASFRQSTSGKSVEQVAAEIIQALALDSKGRSQGEKQ